MREPERKSTNEPTELLGRFSRGDRDAFFELYQANEPAVRALAARFFPSPFEHEEAVQEIWLTVYRTGGSYDARRGPFLAWLRAVAMNRCREILRAKGRRPLADRDLEDAPEESLELEGAGPERAAQHARMREAVARFARSLPEEEARVLELALMEERSLEEVASALSVNIRRCKYLKKKLLVRATSDPGLLRVLEELLGEGPR